MGYIRCTEKDVGKSYTIPSFSHQDSKTGYSNGFLRIDTVGKTNVNIESYTFSGNPNVHRLYVTGSSTAQVYYDSAFTNLNIDVTNDDYIQFQCYMGIPTNPQSSYMTLTNITVS